MDNAVYVGLSRQMVLRRELEIVANNIANADTTGFKVESLVVTEEPSEPAFTLQGPRPVKFVGEDGVLRDFGQGGLRRTGAPLDVAIDGLGFLRANGPDGPRYTRDGRLRLDDNGRLVTDGGLPVADDGGGEIALDPEKGPISIAPDGTVTQGSERVAKLGVVNFATLSTLEKVGDNLYRDTSNQTPQPVADAKLRQGMLESSNVNPILEITRMIEVSRAYEQIARIMESQSQLSTDAVQSLGKVQ
jgi:flagellar basal-body rod protein FlgF